MTAICTGGAASARVTLAKRRRGLTPPSSAPRRGYGHETPRCCFGMSHAGHVVMLHPAACIMPPRIIAMLRQHGHMPLALRLLRGLVGHRIVFGRSAHAAAHHAALRWRGSLGLLAGAPHI